MIQAMTFHTDKNRNKKKAFPITAGIALTFGIVEVLKQGFADQGNCWLMALGVVALCWGVWRANR